MLERRVEKLGVELARALPYGEETLVTLITRTRKLGLGVHWWNTQNILMARPDRGMHEELCQLLGLATATR
jgi:hypothetical protein